MELLPSMKNVELDKICRICLNIKKDMKDLYGESVKSMIEEIANVKIESLDGWPDKICIQCVHQVSRCHAFKSRIERSDDQLKNYIKGITVVVEEPMKEIVTLPARHPESDMKPMQRVIEQVQAQPHMQEIQIQRTDHQPIHQQTHHPLILMNGLNNNTAQIINGQIVTTANGQQLIQTSNGQLIQTATQIGQFVQGPNNTLQMIQNAAPQVLMMSKGEDNEQRCVIVQPADLSDTQFYDEVPVVLSTANGHQTIQILPRHPMQQLAQHVHHQQQHQHQQQQHIQHQPIHVIEHEQQDDEEEEQEQEQEQDQDQDQDQDQEQIEHIQESEEIELHEVQEYEEEYNCESIEEIIEDETETDTSYVIEENVEESSDQDEKQILANFLAAQTSCEGGVASSPGKHVCNLCRKEFKHLKWLHSHMKSHINWIKANCKKRPQCQRCGKTFRGTGMLRMHEKTHLKENKLPSCTICGKEFKSKSILYRHRQTHFDKKIHQCTICEKTFNTNYQLNAHMARHRGEKKHECQHCDKSFYNASDLKNHVQLHLGINKSSRDNKNDNKHAIVEIELQ